MLNCCAVQDVSNLLPTFLSCCFGVFLGGGLITADENFMDNLISAGTGSCLRASDEKEGEPHEKLYRVFCLAYTGGELGTKIPFFSCKR